MKKRVATLIALISIVILASWFSFSPRATGARSPDESQREVLHGSVVKGGPHFEHSKVARLIRQPADQSWTLWLNSEGTYELRVTLAKRGLLGVERGMYALTDGGFTTMPGELVVPNSVKGASDLVPRDYATTDGERFEGVCPVWAPLGAETCVFELIDQ